MSKNNSSEPTSPKSTLSSPNNSGAWNRACGWIRENFFWTVAYLMALIITMYIGNAIFGDEGQISLRDEVLFLLSAILFLGAVRFVHIFTSCINDDSEGMAQEEKSENYHGLECQKRSWLIFSYSFMLFALFSALLPFVFDVEDRKSIDPSNRPIAVFIGCVNDYSKDDSHAQEEIRCKLKDGNITETTVIQTKTTEPIQTAPVSHTTQTTNEYSVITKTVEPISPETDSVTETTEIKFHRYSENGMWVINIGGMVKRCNVDIYCIHGGLSVPLHFVILALFGGAISLTRRIPEYQKRSYAKYIQVDENHPKLKPNQLREYLVFQIVQFVSAPFIALVAYYLVVPESTVVSVTLGFAAGFASETILLMIRAALDKLKPATKTSIKFGSISGVIEHDGNPLKDVNVRLIGYQGFDVTSNGNGVFVMNNVVPGEHILEIKHATGTQIKDAKVTVGQATTCHIKL